MLIHSHLYKKLVSKEIIPNKAFLVFFPQSWKNELEKRYLLFGIPDDFRLSVFAHDTVYTLLIGWNPPLFFSTRLIPNPSVIPQQVMLSSMKPRHPSEGANNPPVCSLSTGPLLFVQKNKFPICPSYFTESIFLSCT